MDAFLREFTKNEYSDCYFAFRDILPDNAGAIFPMAYREAVEYGNGI